ncbi:MAG: carbon-nitrogen hydrolase [Rhodothermales bacterium]
MPDSTMKLGLVQMAMGEDPDANMAKAVDGVREAASGGAEVICLPELFRSRYFCQTEDAALFALAEPIPGPSTETFAELSAELDVTIVASLFERRAAGLYHNTAAVLDGSRGYVGKYRKMHIPDDPRFYEKFYFTPGDLGFKSFATDHGDLGVLICWDQWYPEAARLTALQGAQVLFYPTAIGWQRYEKESHGGPQRDAWITSQRAHAIANGCYVVSVNRTGFEPAPDAADADDGIEFWGSSFVVAPNGQILAQAGTDEETVLLVDAELGEIEALRHGWPFFRDRRIDAYAPLTRRFIDSD